MHRAHHLVSLPSLFKRLDANTRMLVLSFKAMDASKIVVQVFLNTFIWRQFEQLEYSALYNLSFFIGLLVGVWVNSLLLHRFHIGRTFLFSTSFVGACTVLLLLFPPITLSLLIGFGLILGLAYGMYWGNRHLLFIELTGDDDRNYFNGVLGAVGAILKMVLPLVIGWWLATSPSFLQISLQTSYLVVGIATLVLAIFSGFIVAALPIGKIASSRFHLHTTSQAWKLYRYTAFTWGFSRGVTWFLPALLLISFFHGEGPVGYLLSLRELLLVVLLFGIGSHLSKKERHKPAELAAIIYVAIAIVLFLTFTPLSIVLYVFGIGLATALVYSVYDPVFYDAAEHADKYSHVGTGYIVDHELFMTAGRVLGILLLLLFIRLGDIQPAIQWIVLVSAATQVLFVYFLRRLVILLAE